jgi:hypothetical protein
VWAIPSIKASIQIFRIRDHPKFSLRNTKKYNT